MGSVARIWPDFVAVHMVWGAINELTTLAGYQRLAALDPHPVLVDLLGRIIRDESRHFSFYYQQARMRLEQSALARRLTREIVWRFWRPVGNGVKPKAEMYQTIGYCYAWDRGLAAMREADERIAALPGMAGFAMGQEFLEELARARV